MQTKISLSLSLSLSPSLSLPLSPLSPLSLSPPSPSLAVIFTLGVLGVAVKSTENFRFPVFASF